jgi:predicted XRE-type DNA-binding protein
LEILRKYDKSQATDVIFDSRRCMTMKLNEALKHTLAKYDIEQKELHLAAVRRGEKLAENTISDFMNAKTKVQSDTLDKILQSLEEINPEAKRYFAYLLLIDDYNPNFFRRPKRNSQTLVPA